MYFIKEEDLLIRKLASCNDKKAEKWKWYMVKKLFLLEKMQKYK